MKSQGQSQESLSQSQVKMPVSFSIHRPTEAASQEPFLGTSGVTDERRDIKVPLHGNTCSAGPVMGCSPSAATGTPVIVP